MLRHLATLLSLTLIATAVAQRPLVVPNYFVSQLPRLVAGQPLYGELTPADGQNFKDGSRLDMYQFEGPEGGFVTLHASSDGFDTYLSVFGPDGMLVASDDDTDPGVGGGAYSSYVELYLDQPGKYTAVVSGYSQYDLGAYALELRTEAAFTFGGGETIEVPGAYGGYLEATDPLVPGGWTGPGKGYDFTLDEPTVLKIDAASHDFDTYIYLFDENGFLLASNDDEDYSEATGFATDSMLFASLKPGRYVVYVSTWSSEGEGEYQLSFEEYVPRR